MSFDVEPYDIQIVRDIPIRCLRCGNEFFITVDEIEHDDSREDAPMGLRIHHDFYTECTCPRCKQWISFQLAVFEYPIGSIEYIDNYKCNGGDVLETPEVDIPYYDDNLYVSVDSVYTRQSAVEPIPLNLGKKLAIDVADGDATIGDQLYASDGISTIWASPAGRLLPILVDETGSIRFDENKATFAEILLTNPNIGAMRLLGKVAEAVLVRNCAYNRNLNRRWLSKAKRERLTQGDTDPYKAIGTGLHSTKRTYPHKYSPSDPQRDIIWIDENEDCALVKGFRATSGRIAGLQVKVSGNGLNYIRKPLTNRYYEVPLVYFPMSNDYDTILDKVNHEGVIVEPGADFIDVREIDTNAFYEIQEYYPLLQYLFSGRMSVDEFVMKASGMVPLRNGILATTLSATQSDIRIYR